MQISRGAEAIIRKEDDALVKERIKKSYRIAQLDERLRKQRTKLEANLLNEARRVGIATPKVLEISEFEIRLEEVKGQRLKEILNEKKFEELGKKIGFAIARLHEYNIIHGDLTTSNMILKDEKVYFIDFGLGFQSSRVEDKAVDLFLLRHAIESTHWNLLDKLWRVIIESYKENYNQADKVSVALEGIEKRGRYRVRSLD